MWNGDKTVKHNERQTLLGKKRKTSGKIIKARRNFCSLFIFNYMVPAMKGKGTVRYLLYEETVLFIYPPIILSLVF